MTPEPKVSVIIPTYNRAPLLKKAILSVLDQTLSDWELIVADDGSTDDTGNVVNSFHDQRIHYIYQENRGVSSARNLGLRVAKGQYLAFLDSDDRFCPQKLEKCAAFMDGHPETGMVYGKYHIIDKDDQLLGVGPAHFSETFTEIYKRCSPQISASLIRKSVLEDVGWFDTSLAVCEDLDLWLRIAQKYIINFINEIVAYYRNHSESLSADVDKFYQATLVIHKRLGPKPQLGISKKRYLQGMAKMNYLLARGKWNQNLFCDAMAYLQKAIVQSPAVGLLIPKERPRSIRRIWYFVKPYIFYVASFFRCYFRIFISRDREQTLQ